MYIVDVNIVSVYMVVLHERETQLCIYMELYVTMNGNSVETSQFRFGVLVEWLVRNILITVRLITSAICISCDFFFFQNQGYQ